jgi:ABC-type oligopeptide transport system substrate-binding subunit
MHLVAPTDSLNLKGGRFVASDGHRLQRHHQPAQQDGKTQPSRHAARERRRVREALDLSIDRQALNQVAGR